MSEHSKGSFVNQSYQFHEDHLKDQIHQKKDPLIRLKNKGSIDYWRHEQIYNYLNPFIIKDQTWLTIGDGIGTDAAWLQQSNVSVLASDIGDHLLKLAKEQNFIREYSKINAEEISLDDESFDYVLCKEAYHHFPRPYLAIYEMLRVCKKAAIIIEPQDPIQRVPWLLFLKNILYQIKKPSLLKKIWKNQYSFEEVGNYVYKISEREIEKIAMGAGLPAIAVAGINMYYSNSPEMGRIPAPKQLLAKAKLKLSFKNSVCSLGLIPHNLLCCVIFKNLPSSETIQKLKDHGYTFIQLPENPYTRKNEFN